MRIKTTAFFGLAATALFAGCGGGDGLTFDERVAQAEAFADRVFTDYPDATPEGTPLPPGEATYNGYAGVDTFIEGEAEFFIGDLEMVAVFGDPSISGQIDNIAGEFSGPVAGTIDIESAPIDALNEYFADVSGAVTVDGVTYTVIGDSEGGFGGPDFEAVAGDLLGEVYDGLDLVGDFGGTYVGER